jgi:Ca2+-binding RTX toxin-like protein
MTNKTNHSRAARRLGLAAGVAGVAAALATAGPAAALPSNTAFVAQDTLIVKGSRNNDRIALRLEAGQPGILQVDFGDDGTAEHSFDRATFSRINIFARSGHDQVRIDQVNGAFADEAVTMYGGRGNDTLDGGDGAELFIGGRGRDAVDGNRGDDTGLLGSGWDSFRWDPGDGSDVVEGQAGYDTLDFNGANVDEQMSLTPNGSRSLFLRTQGNIRMDMDGVEKLDLTALAGVDTITVDDMSGTDFRRAAVDLQGPAGGPDGADDVVIVNGTAGRDRIDLETEGPAVVAEGLQTKVRITGSERADLVQVNTLDGNDDVDVDGTVFALIDIDVDLGPGQS